MNAASSPARSASSSSELAAIGCKPDSESDENGAEHRVEGAVDRWVPENVSRLGYGGGVRRQPREGHGTEEQTQPEERRERLAELRQQAREEHGHLRIAEVADETLSERGVTPDAPGLGGLAADCPQECVHAQIDEERGAGELERDEGGLEGDDQRSQPDARRERPDRLAGRDAERREDPAPPAAEQR